MSEPLVCCVCLANGRPAMLRRAVASFAAQAYANRCMLIWDNATPAMSAEEAKALFKMDPRVFIKHGDKRSIGAMRNDAAKWMFSGPSPHPEIIAHFDSDDASNANRLTEQVAQLQSSGADVVGYHQMLFWKEPWEHCVTGAEGPIRGEHPGEAWLYTGRPPQVLGTSLCYWASAWKQKPFRDQSIGEDLMWVSGLKMRTASSIPEGQPSTGRCRDYADASCVDESGQRWVCTHGPCAEPRMIASIHGGNSSTFLNPTMVEWKRVPQWDDCCREAMRLELHK